MEKIQILLTTKENLRVIIQKQKNGHHHHHHHNHHESHRNSGGVSARPNKIQENGVVTTISTNKSADHHRNSIGSLPSDQNSGTNLRTTTNISSSDDEDDSPKEVDNTLTIANIRPSNLPVNHWFRDHHWDHLASETIFNQQEKSRESQGFDNEFDDWALQRWADNGYKSSNGTI